jgi:hypothetical protein
LLKKERATMNDEHHERLLIAEYHERAEREAQEGTSVAGVAEEEDSMRWEEELLREEGDRRLCCRCLHAYRGRVFDNSIRRLQTQTCSNRLSTLSRRTDSNNQIL